jgi:formylmethanofuran dehydrogenase subunit A
VPFAYRRRSPTSCLQFAIGLEIMLLSPDPARTLLTTDHPNGGPFTAYPRILHLLMDKAERDREIASLDPIVAARTGLGAIEREYGLPEVAAMTRLGPARLLGLDDRGHLAPGARADIAVYRDDLDRTAMFAAARLVLKDGAVVVEDGEVVARPEGRTLSLGLDADAGMRARTDAYLSGRYGRGLDGFSVPDAAFPGREVFARDRVGVRHG